MVEAMDESVDYVMGIDLGTTNSCVGVWSPQTNKIEIVPNEKGNFTTPSIVFFAPNGQILVGDDAMMRFGDGTGEKVIHDVKRLIGRPWSHPQREK